MMGKDSNSGGCKNRSSNMMSKMKIRRYQKVSYHSYLWMANLDRVYVWLDL